jgi:hypothetical protein
MNKRSAQLPAAGQTGAAPSSSGQGSGSSGASATSTLDTPPVIQVNGDNPAIVQVGATYNDLGATLIGPQADLNLGFMTYLNGVLTSPLQLDTSQPATDTIDYVATTNPASPPPQREPSSSKPPPTPAPQPQPPNQPRLNSATGRGQAVRNP